MLEVGVGVVILVGEKCSLGERRVGVGIGVEESWEWVRIRARDSWNWKLSVMFKVGVEFSDQHLLVQFVTGRKDWCQLLHFQTVKATYSKHLKKKKKKQRPIDKLYL